jgi:hypothetical protein
MFLADVPSSRGPMTSFLLGWAILLQRLVLEVLAFRVDALSAPNCMIGSALPPGYGSREPKEDREHAVREEPQGAGHRKGKRETDDPVRIPTEEHEREAHGDRRHEQPQ